MTAAQGHATKLRTYAGQLPTVLSVPNFARDLFDAADEIDRLNRIIDSLLGKDDAILSRRSVETECGPPLTSARPEAHYENALTRIANAAQTTGHRVMRDIARRALEESHV